MLVCKYVDENGSPVKASASVIPEVNLMEPVLHMLRSSVNKVAHFGFESQRRHYQKSKIRGIIVHQIFFKKRELGFRSVIRVVLKQNHLSTFPGYIQFLVR